MSEKNKSKSKNFDFIYSYDFESLESDPGIKYIENFHKRRMETITNKEVILALKNAALRGNGDETKSNLQFVRELITNDLALKTTKKERNEVFQLAAKVDLEKNKFFIKGNVPYSQFLKNDD